MVTTKVCSVCGLEKKLTEFPKNGRDKEGAVRYRADCKECYNISRKINKKRLFKFLNNIKHRTGEEDGYSFEDWKDAVLYFRGKCAYCGRPQSRNNILTKDHIVPVSKGGKTVRENIVPSCVRCNSSKSDSDFEEWYVKQKFYSDDRKDKIIRWRISSYEIRNELQENDSST